jgi:quercetin dioxygenase-like cupin family protein
LLSRQLTAADDFNQWRVNFMNLSSRGLAVLVTVIWLAYPAALEATDRLLVLVGQDRIGYYRIDASNATLVKTYGRDELPKAFPARSLAVTGGNLVTTYDERGNPVGRLLFEGLSEKLVSYTGDSSTAGGRILTQPGLQEPFRKEGSLYDKAKDARRRLELEKVSAQAGPGHYLDVFALGGKVCGLRADAIECRPDNGGSPSAGKMEPWLQLSGARLTAAAVSPWQELFVADASGPKVRRFQVQNGALVAAGEIGEKSDGTPVALAFSADGELFVASNRSGGNPEVVRYGFVLDNFVSWRPTVRNRIRVDGSALDDLALLRPVGYVVSDKTHPPLKLPATQAGGHFGISQSVPISPPTTSESAVLAVVEYEPGGHTPVHLHPDMEQMEVVLSGRALWEVGEMEREVGPGDIIFCPRNVKHGYKVLGNQPFRFFQIEWREWKQDK